MIKNENGDVAVTYFQEINKQVRVGDGTRYAWSVKRNVSLAWVNPEHVDHILSKTRNCCGGGGRKKGVFRLSSQQEVNLWTGVGVR